MVYVTKDGWNVCYVERAGHSGIELWAWKFDSSGARTEGEGHEQVFPSKDKATQFAFEHGYLQVYEPRSTYADLNRYHRVITNVETYDFRLTERTEWICYVWDSVRPMRCLTADQIGAGIER